MENICTLFWWLYHFFKDVSSLQAIFQRFREANLEINQSKCSFFQTKVQFLGHVVNENGLQKDHDKTKTVFEFSTPENQTQLKSLLALAF